MGRYQVVITKEVGENLVQNSNRVHVEVKEVDGGAKVRKSVNHNSADFNIIDPVVRSVRVQAYKNFASQFSRTSSKNRIEEVNENGSDQIFRSELITYSQGKARAEKDIPLWPKGKDSTDLDLTGEGSFLEINTQDLEPNSLILHNIVVDKSNTSNSNSEEVFEDDVNQNQPETPSVVPRDYVNHELLSCYDHRVHRESRDPLIVGVGNILVITVQFEGKPGKKESNNSIVQIAKFETTSPIFTPVLDGPQDEVGFSSGLQTSLLSGDFLQERTVEDEVRRRLQKRVARKDLLRALIYEKLVGLRVSPEVAHEIIHAWNKDYTQHRPLSYRITNTQDPSTLPILTNAFGNLVPAQRFALNFLQHAQIIQGMLDSATCTVIEAIFCLLLPHLKPCTNNQDSGERKLGLIDEANNEKFMKDWVQVLFAVAHQLKPMSPDSVTGLVAKEVKLIGKPIQKIPKIALKVRKESNVIRGRLEKLRKKVVKRIEPQIDFMKEVLEKKYPKSKPILEKAYGRLLLPENLTAEKLMENSMHLGVGNHGLLIKQKSEDKWFSFADLNFVERRVIFLGMTEHMYSSFDAVLRTLRHLSELYTPGYPGNIVTGVDELFNDLKKERFIQLEPQTRMFIYQKMYGLLDGVNRFENVLYQLVGMTKDVQKEIFVTEYNASRVMENVIQNRSHAHLVIPFATFRVEGLADLKSRGFEIEMPQSDLDPEAQSQPGSNETHEFNVESGADAISKHDESSELVKETEISNEIQ